MQEESTPYKYIKEIRSDCKYKDGAWTQFTVFSMWERRAGFGRVQLVHEDKMVEVYGWTNLVSILGFYVAVMGRELANPSHSLHSFCKQQFFKVLEFIHKRHIPMMEVLNDSMARLEWDNSLDMKDIRLKVAELFGAKIENQVKEEMTERPAPVDE